MRLVSVMAAACLLTICAIPAAARSNVGVRWCLFWATKENHQKGSADLTFHVRKDHSVTDIALVNSTGDQDLDRKLVDCVSKINIDQEPRDGQWSGQLSWDFVPSDFGSEWTFATIGPMEGNATPPLPVGKPHTCDEYYSADAMLSGLSGTTKLSFIVTEDGSVKDLAITERSTSKRLDEASMECVSHWKYRPATVGGRPVTAKWSAEVKW
ncbi:MAG TPA: energy transducer TonB [Rhizomicrobium sp.]|nr:energy transducer TonB [Rhizomicrobium sp.]